MRDYKISSFFLLGTTLTTYTI